MKYGLLNQKNEAYKPVLWTTLDDLYVGGFQILEHAAKYIPRQLGETDKRYKERLSLASYINYLSLVIDEYAGNLFASEPVVVAAPDDDDEDAKPPTIDEYWETFEKDSNLKGESFAKLLRCAFTTGILNGRALIACDLPNSDIYPDPTSRAEEDAQGRSRAYSYELPLEELIDWSYSEVVTRKATVGGKEFEFTFGRLAWAILRREVCGRATPMDTRNTFVEEFRVWGMDPVSGFAQWELFRTKPRKKDEPAPTDDDEIPSVGRGITTFREIPIVEFCLPKGLWLGNLLGTLALNLFRRRSALHASENRNLFPQPVIKLGPEVTGVGEAMPSEVQQNPTRSVEAIQALREQGVMVLGKDDTYEYAEPSGTIFKIVDEQIKGDVDEFFRIAHMMASSISNTTSALGRSGVSKQQDRNGMAIVLEAFSAIVKDFGIRVHHVITEARKEDISWRLHGLDKFDVIDRTIVIEEVKAMGLVNIPSTTFKLQYLTKTALELLGNVPPAMQETIRKEIAAGLVAEEAMRTLLLEDDPENDDPDPDADADGNEKPIPAQRPPVTNGGPQAKPQA